MKRNISKLAIVHESPSYCSELNYEYFDTFEEARAFYMANENKLDVLYVNFLENGKYVDDSERIFYDNF